MQERLEHFAKLGDVEALKALARLNFRKSTTIVRRPEKPCVMRRVGRSLQGLSNGDGFSGLDPLGDGHNSGYFSSGRGCNESHGDGWGSGIGYSDRDNLGNGEGAGGGRSGGGGFSRR